MKSMRENKFADKSENISGNFFPDVTQRYICYFFKRTYEKNNMKRDKGRKLIVRPALIYHFNVCCIKKSATFSR